MQGADYKQSIGIQEGAPEVFTGNVLKTPVLYSRLTIETMDILGCFARFCCCHFLKSNSSSGMSHILHFARNNTALLRLQCHRLALSSVPRDALPCTCFIICDAFSAAEALGTIFRSQKAFAHGSHHLRFLADKVPPFAAFP